MPKLKHIYVPAVVGFVLSFLISLIATHHFLRALLRASLCGVASAALGALVSFVYEKFLSEGLNAEAAVQDSSRRSTVGSAVDITISDEDLTPDDAGPQFAVSQEVQAPLSGTRDGSTLAGDTGGAAYRPHTAARQEVREAPVAVSASPQGSAATGGASGPAEVPRETGSAAASVGEQPAPAQKPASGFQPMNLAGQPAESALQGGGAAAEDVDNLDELPEIGELNLVGSDSLVEDSDFAEDGAKPVSSRVEYADGSSPASQDAETMAKAIRTLLKRED